MAMTMLNAKMTELKLSSKQQEAIREVVELMLVQTRASSGQKHPNKLDAEGNLSEKWCSKHQMYHAVEHFPKSRSSKDGLYSHCRFAERRAKYYAKRVKQVQEQVFIDMNLGKEVDMDAVRDQVNKYKLLGSKYDWEADSKIPMNGKYNG